MLCGNSRFILGVYSDILSALVDIMNGITVCFGFFNITVAYYRLQWIAASEETK